MKRLVLALVLAGVASEARSVTLTITPDKAVYSLGETITLNVFGDAEGGEDNLVTGTLLFDASLAAYVGSGQSTLTSFGGAVPWTAVELIGGPGFAVAFRQLGGQHLPNPIDAPLVASVTLLAAAPGTLVYEWQVVDAPYPLEALDFFDIGTAPGGSVTIVPEPSTALLLALGLLRLASRKRA